MSIPDPSAQPRRNLELKVRLSREGLVDVRERVLALGVPMTCQRQVDRYFDVPQGRLKLRAIAYDTEPSRAELIAYRRPDEQGSRWSVYRITPVDPDLADDLAATLAHVLQVVAEVRKRRDIAIWRSTRIHLDDVDGLGYFLELETVLSEQDGVHAEAEHREAIERLGLAAWPVEATSYSDMLGRKPAL